MGDLEKGKDLDHAEELDRAEVELLESSSKSYQCPSCAGQMHFDPDSEKMMCRYCQSYVDIDCEADEKVKKCFHEAMKSGVRSWTDDDVETLSCGNCGAELFFDGHSKSQFCGYCGSSHIRAQKVDQTIPPDDVIPFKISEKKARESFENWLKGKWFAPKDIKKAFERASLTGTYIPYWSYDTETSSHYTAQRGDHYYVTRTRRVNGKTQTVRERRTRWRRVSGGYDKKYEDVLVCASSKIDEDILSGISGFSLKEKAVYRPEYLSGFMAERYSVSLDDGWIKGKQSIDQDLKHDITGRIGGDVVRGLNVHSQYDDLKFKHLLAPLWICSYQYKQRTYHFMVHGQSGRVSGKYPKCAKKIAFVLFFSVVMLVIIYLLIQGYVEGAATYMDFLGAEIWL